MLNPNNAPGPRSLRSVFATVAGEMEVTTAGCALLDTLNALLAADKSPEAFARWEAWELLKIEVGASGNNNPPTLSDFEAHPLLFVAALAVNAWIAAHIQAETEGSRTDA